MWMDSNAGVVADGEQTIDENGVVLQMIAVIHIIGPYKREKIRRVNLPNFTASILKMYLSASDMQ